MVCATDIDLILFRFENYWLLQFLQRKQNLIIFRPAFASLGAKWSQGRSRGTISNVKESFAIDRMDIPYTVDYLEVLRC